MKEKISQHIDSVMTFNVFKKYGVDKYLASDGLAVQPEYRKRGIAGRLLKVRKAICTENGLTVTSTTFTTETSIRLAKRVGFKTDKSTRYFYNLNR